VPVEEPSTASGADVMTRICADGVYEAGCDSRNALAPS